MTTRQNLRVPRAGKEQEIAKDYTVYEPTIRHQNLANYYIGQKSKTRRPFNMFSLLFMEKAAK